MLAWKLIITIQVFLKTVAVNVYPHINNRLASLLLYVLVFLETKGILGFWLMNLLKLIEKVQMQMILTIPAHQFAYFPKSKVSCCWKNDVDWSQISLFLLVWTMNVAKSKKHTFQCLRNMVLWKNLEGTRLETLTLFQNTTLCKFLERRLEEAYNSLGSVIKMIYKLDKYFFSSSVHLVSILRDFTVKMNNKKPLEQIQEGKKVGGR